MRTLYKPTTHRRETIREPINAKYLLAPVSTTPEIPADFPITHCPPRVAQGARKPRMSGGFKGAMTTANIARSADRRALLAYAYRGMK